MEVLGGSRKFFFTRQEGEEKKFFWGEFSDSIGRTSSFFWILTPKETNV